LRKSRATSGCDSLYIDLSERSSAESKEVSQGVVLDYDADEKLVEIDIENASNKVELEKLILSKLPGKVETAAAGVTQLECQRCFRPRVGV
jgi:uncharacterized protein YuzE